jgi:hypothetical protein
MYKYSYNYFCECKYINHVVEVYIFIIVDLWTYKFILYIS